MCVKYLLRAMKYIFNLDLDITSTKLNFDLLVQKIMRRFNKGFIHLKLVQ